MSQDLKSPTGGKEPASLGTAMENLPKGDLDILKEYIVCSRDIIRLTNKTGITGPGQSPDVTRAKTDLLAYSKLVLLLAQEHYPGLVSDLDINFVLDDSTWGCNRAQDDDASDDTIVQNTVGVADHHAQGVTSKRGGDSASGLHRARDQGAR